MGKDEERNYDVFYICTNSAQEGEMFIYHKHLLIKLKQGYECSLVQKATPSTTRKSKQTETLYK